MKKGKVRVLAGIMGTVLVWMEVLSVGIKASAAGEVPAVMTEAEAQEESTEGTVEYAAQEPENQASENSTEKEGTQENYDRLLRLVKGLVEDLKDVLYRQSIEAYRVAGEEVDVRRQKIIQTLETEDPAQDNFIAVRVADGYEKGDKVLRPERIKIYKYHKKSPDADDK